MPSSNPHPNARIMAGTAICSVRGTRTSNSCSTGCRVTKEVPRSTCARCTKNDGELFQDRLVQTKLRPHRRQRLGRRDLIAASGQDGSGGIPGYDMDDPEDKRHGENRCKQRTGAAAEHKAAGNPSQPIPHHRRVPADGNPVPAPLIPAISSTLRGMGQRIVAHHLRAPMSDGVALAHPSYTRLASFRYLATIRLSTGRATHS